MCRDYFWQIERTRNDWDWIGKAETRFVADGKTAADGLRPWNNWQDTLRDYTLRQDHEDCFIADGKDAREANVDSTRGNA